MRCQCPIRTAMLMRHFLQPTLAVLLLPCCVIAPSMPRALIALAGRTYRLPPSQRRALHRAVTAALITRSTYQKPLPASRTAALHQLLHEPPGPPKLDSACVS